MYMLRNQMVLPRVGLGTAELLERRTASEIEELIVEACKNGCKLFDTAPVYGSEEVIGRGLAKAIANNVIDREDVIISTKLSNEAQGYHSTLQAFEDSRECLGVEYIDVYLIHWPIPKGHEEDYRELNVSSWKAMEELYQQGKVKAIGVCNFLPRHIENILRHADIPPMVNQLEIHPWYQQTETVRWCQEHDILVEAWGPLNHGAVMQSRKLEEMAHKYYVSPAQLVLAWLTQRNILPIPKASSIKRICENQEIPPIVFEEEDRIILHSMDSVDGHAAYWNYKRQLNF